MIQFLDCKDTVFQSDTEMFWAYFLFFLLFPLF